MSSLTAPNRSLNVFPDLGTLAAGAAFEIRREDIDWRLVGPGELEIEVTIRNASTRATPPTSAYVRSAAFGAFVEHRPLTTLDVPPLAPRGRVTLTAAVPVAALARADALGSNPPRAPRIASAARDGSMDGDGPDATVRSMLRAAAQLRTLVDDGEPSQVRMLALRRLGVLMGRMRRQNWMGNLNVFVGSVSAERHQARGLVVHPEVENILLFHLGDGRPDAYRFRLEGGAGAWAPRLHEQSGRELALSVPSDWFELRSRACMQLVLQPPKLAQPDRAELHVQRRSTGQVAVVEFELLL